MSSQLAHRSGVLDVEREDRMIQGRDGGRVTAPKDASWMVESDDEAQRGARVKANAVSDAACSELEDKVQ